MNAGLGFRRLLGLARLLELTFYSSTGALDRELKGIMQSSYSIGVSMGI